MIRKKIKAGLKLARPFTLLAPAVGGLLFSYLGYLHQPGPIYKIFLTSLIFVFANYTSNVINQVYDREIDRINKPYRPIPSGEISVDEANSLAIILTIVTLAMAYTLINTTFGLLLSVIMFFAWIYSAPPLRLRAKLFWSNLALAAPRGALGIITAYTAYANPLENINLLIFAFGMALYVFGANTFKDIPDELGDKKLGIKNFVTVYGRKKALKIAFIFIAASYVPVALSLSNLIYSAPLGITIIAMLFFGIKHPDIKTKTENTILWTLFYLGMIAGFLSFFTSQIL